MKSLNPYLLAYGLLVMGGALAVTAVDGNTVFDIIANPMSWGILVVVAFLVMTYAAVVKAQEAVSYYIAKKEGRLPVTEEEKAAAAIEEEEQPSWAERLLQKLQDSKPVEEEEEIELDHNYDGIRELDNNLPPWWLYGFYASIIFAVIYLVRYHVTHSAPLPLEEYSIEMAQAAQAKEEYLKTAANLVDETNVTQLTEAPKLEAGGKIFATNCAVCHAPDGGGGVGPNLTDAYWLHGGGIKDVFGTIKYGVPSKGMISWKDQLTPQQIQQVASYVLSLQGTTPADPKDPQGDLYEASEVEEAGTETDVQEAVINEPSAGDEDEADSEAGI